MGLILRILFAGRDVSPLLLPFDGRPHFVVGEDGVADVLQELQFGLHVGGGVDAGVCEDVGGNEGGGGGVGAGVVGEVGDGRADFRL